MYTADFLPNEVLLRISYSLISTCVVVVCDSRGPAILQTVMASSEPITVAYWATRGLGAPLRMMVMYANHPLNCVLYDYDVKDGSFDGSLWTDAKQTLKEKTPIINLPYVNVKDMWVCQSIACSTYIGRKLSMNGKDDDEISSCEQMLNEVLVFRALLYGMTSATVDSSSAITWAFTLFDTRTISIGYGPQKQDCHLGVWSSWQRSCINISFTQWTHGESSKDLCMA